MSLAGIDTVLPMQEIAGAPKDRIVITATHNTFQCNRNSDYCNDGNGLNFWMQ